MTWNLYLFLLCYVFFILVLCAVTEDHDGRNKICCLYFQLIVVVCVKNSKNSIWNFDFDHFLILMNMLRFVVFVYFNLPMVLSLSSP